MSAGNEEPPGPFRPSVLLTKEPPPVTGPAGPLVDPSGEDEVAAAGSELIGGPTGRRARFGAGWWNPLRVLAVLTIVVYALGLLQKAPCYAKNWAGPQYTHACYTDIAPLFTARGFASGLTPYFDWIPNSISGAGGFHYLEYPVLTGWFMKLAAVLTPGGGSTISRVQAFWFVNVALLLICALVMVLAVSMTHRRRPWDALMVAIAPVLALDSTINWDLLAVALAAVGMMLWSRRHPAWAGVLIGLATAAKFYPLFLLGPLVLLCLRAGKWRQMGQVVGGAVLSWLVVNLPVMIWAWDGWKEFYTYSFSRGVDFGSFWLVLQQRGVSLPGSNNVWVSVLTILLICGVALLALLAPRRPRFAQLAFLAVAVFVVVNKVYSPQYVLWLLPLAVLARPRWRDFLIWQGCQVAYFFAVWYYLADTTSSPAKGLPQTGYQIAIVLQILGTVYLIGMVVWDVLGPHRDVVRADGSDDPSGGVLDGAPDRFPGLAWRGDGPAAVPAGTAGPGGGTTSGGATQVGGAPDGSVELDYPGDWPRR